MSANTRGYLFAIAAFVLWGCFPFYFKLVSHVPALEVLANRVIWSLLFLGVLLIILRFWPQTKAILANKKYRRSLFFATLLIATNWGVYIWAVANERIFDASLGYYINPLVNIFLAFCILKERLKPIQWIAVALASIGVCIQLVLLGEFPWIALSLAFSFGLYGLYHKLLDLEAMPGLFVETLFLFPIALVFLAYQAFIGIGPAVWSLDDWWILALAGPVTVVPLLFFTAATRRIPYSVIGFLQYIVPSILFLLAAFFYKEPFSLSKLITFGFIWAGLLLITWDALRSRSMAVVGS